MSNKKTRNANIEILRMLSMFMVTMLHALGKSDLLVDMSGNVGINGFVAWIFEALSIGAVNIFMLISGYFLINSEFRIAKLIELVLQTLFYSVGSFLVFLIFGLTGREEITLYTILNQFLPVHMEVFWFITAYVVLYMLSPILTKGVKAVSQKTLGIVILMLVIYESIFKSILPIRLTTDTKGYTFFWYIIVFLIGAYIRLYGVRYINSTLKGLIVYAAGAVLVFAETFAIGKIYGRTGRLAMLTGVALEYNHIFVLILAIGIFLAFLHMPQMSEKPGRIISIVSSMALGVYLFQENLMMRYEWQKWFGLPDAMNDNVLIFILRIIGAVSAMYILGTVVDLVRKLIFKGVTVLVSKIKRPASVESEDISDAEDEGKADPDKK